MTVMTAWRPHSDSPIICEQLTHLSGLETEVGTLKCPAQGKHFVVPRLLRVDRFYLLDNFMCFTPPWTNVVSCR